MRDALASTQTTLTTLLRLGTLLAAKLIGHVSRFPTEHHFASYTGSAPLDASSGNNVRHRLNTGVIRALNSVLHVIAIGCVPLEGSADAAWGVLEPARLYRGGGGVVADGLVL
jgi:transposase